MTAIMAGDARAGHGASAAAQQRPRSSRAVERIDRYAPNRLRCARRESGVVAMEPLFEMLLECVMQAVFEIVASAFMRPPKAGGPRAASPWLLAFGFLLLGAFAGGLSWLLSPVSFLTSPLAIYAHVVLTPIGVGFLMVAIGSWRARRELPLARLHRFAFAYLFALAMALVRLAICR